MEFVGFCFRQLVFCSLAVLAEERNPVECLDAFGATGEYEMYRTPRKSFILVRSSNQNLKKQTNNKITEVLA